MRPKRWNLWRATGYGAIAGLAYGLFRLFTEYSGSALSFGLGTVAGSVLGAAVVFGLIAGLRNLVLRAQ